MNELLLILALLGAAWLDGRETPNTIPPTPAPTGCVDPGFFYPRPGPVIVVDDEGNVVERIEPTNPCEDEPPRREPQTVDARVMGAA